MLLIPLLALPSANNWWLDPCNDERVRSLPYCDSHLSSSTRAADLVSRLTTTEKVSMVNGAPPIDRRANGVAVPPMQGGECLHSAGVDTYQDNHGFRATNFPTPIAIGASWDKDLAHQVAAAVATEARAKANIALGRGQYGWNLGSLCYAPVVNLARDPRWGRLQETYSEDPTHAGIMGSAYVRGLREGERTTTRSAFLMTVPLLKHLDAYGGPENEPSVGPDWNGIRSGFDAVVPLLDQRTTFQPAFRAGVHAGALGAMCSYNAINGVPSCVSRELLTGLLRGEWRCGEADGGLCVVRSDYNAIEFASDRHHFMPTFEEAAAAALNAGCDLITNRAAMNVTASLLSALRDGLLSEATLDASVRNLVALNVLAGAFEPPSAVPDLKALDATAIGSDAHIALARSAAARAVTLLTNREATLPLSPTLRGEQIAIIGPAANDTVAMQASYSALPTDTQSVYDAAVATFGADVAFAVGCELLNCTTDAGFAHAVAAARGRVAIVAVGTTWYCGGSGGELGYGQPAPECEMEGSDRLALTLPGMQEKLVHAVMAVAAKTIVVLVAAGPISAPSMSAKADALVQSYFGGQAMASALMDVMTGAVAPSGRLPYTVPASVDDVPPISSYAMAAPPGRTYRFSTRPPLFPFGYGLSYASFSLRDLVVSPPTVAPCNSAVVSVTISHVAGPASAEIVQLYAARHGGAVGAGVRPELRGFARVELLPGESKSVQITLGPAEMATPRASDYEMEVAPGTLTVFVGSGQPHEKAVSTLNKLNTTLRVDGAARALEKC